MQSFKSFPIILTIILSFSSFAQTQADFDWLGQSMKKKESVSQEMAKKGILETYAPGVVEQQIQQYKESAALIANQSNSIIAKTLNEKMGVSKNDANVFAGGTANSSDSSVPPISAIFVSFSMPHRELVQAFEEADSVAAEIYFRGMHPDDKSVTDTMNRIKQIMASSKARPSARFNPKAFIEFNVSSVPVIVHARSGNVAYVSGILNFDWLQEQMDYTNGLTNLGVRGPIKKVLERDIIQELQARMRGIDMEGKKKKAVTEFWQKQQFSPIPDATEDKVHFIDPTVRVQKDIVNPAGKVLARAGQEVNPLDTAISKNTYILFNAKNATQIDWAKNQLNLIGYNGIAMLMIPELDRDKGWENLADLRKQFNRDIYIIPKQMVDRFFISGLPALVTTDQSTNMIKVQQFNLGGTQ